MDTAITSYENPASTIATIQSIRADREERGHPGAPRLTHACKCHQLGSLHITASLVARHYLASLLHSLYGVLSEPVHICPKKIGSAVECAGGCAIDGSMMVHDLHEASIVSIEQRHVKLVQWF